MCTLPIVRYLAAINRGIFSEKIDQPPPPFGGHMSRLALAPRDANLPAAALGTKPRVRSKSDSFSGQAQSEPSPEDDEIWNLTQRVAHLQAALDQTTAANLQLTGEITRLENVESDLGYQRSVNAALFADYLAIRADEESRLYHDSDE